VSPILTVALAASLGILAWATFSDPLLHHQVSVENSLRGTIYTAALAVDAERAATGSYPATLEDIGMDEEGLSYQSDSNGYRLTATDEGVEVVYRSGEDLQPYRAAFNALLPPHITIQ
jgi:hypothetical protein